MKSNWRHFEYQALEIGQSLVRDGIYRTSDPIIDLPLDFREKKDI